MPMAGCHKSRGKYIVTGENIGEEEKEFIDPPTKVIMNLWKKERLDVWGSLRASDMIESAS